MAYLRESLFENAEEASILLRPGVVITIDPTGGEKVRILIQSEVTYGKSMGRTSVYLWGTRVTARNGIWQGGGKRDKWVCLLGQITSVEIASVTQLRHKGR